jgi:Holliday junction resolvase RusA-like endonuclease
MITRHWGFKVYGVPKPKGSMKCIGARGTRKHVLVEQVDDGGWRDLVTTLAQAHVHEQADAGQPIEIEVVFTADRPASHYGTGKNRHKLKLSAPVWPTHSTGDIDKLSRLILDALQTAGALRNDAQVVRLTSVKQYADMHPGQRPEHRWDVLPRPGAIIRLRPLGLA